MNHVACYKKDYPRPQFVRDRWQLLNGTWDFAFDDKNIGEALNWGKGFLGENKIEVPFSYQTEASGVAETARHDYIWYSRKVSFDRDTLKKQRLILWFEGSDYITKVWVNGVFIGKHEGGYTRFGFDVTDAAPGAGGSEFLLVVKCEDGYDATQPRGKQKWKDDPFGCWYVETNGLWKSVWCEYVDARHIERIKFSPDPATYCVNFEAEIAKIAADMTLTTQILWRGNLVSESTVRVVRDKFSYSIDLQNDFHEFRIHWWSFGCPDLYDVKFILRCGDETVDEAGSYLGFRSFYAKGDTLMLNNGPTYLKLVLEQGYLGKSGMTYPSEEKIAEELELIKSFGFNGLRMHQKIEDERLFYYADVLGLCTWVEMPSPYEFREATIEKVISEWMQVVKQHYNHPSVLVWVPFNESWGVPCIMNDSRQQHFTEALYHLTKAYDKMRPVISNDGWEHTTSDIVTLHNYVQSPESLSDFYQRLDDVLSGKNFADYSQWRLPFAGGYSYHGQPIMITEFAGIGFNVAETNGGWGYGDAVGDCKKFTERLAGLVKALRENNRICGFCVTQITDVEAETNGLCDLNRKPKADKTEIAKAIQQ